MWVRTQDIYNWQYHCFQPIKVSFYTYPFISIHDTMPRILLLSLTGLIIPTDKVITQTIFVVLFTSRSLSHLGETPGCFVWCLPQVFICHQFSTNCILSLQIFHDGQLCLLFPGLWLIREGPCITLGAPKHLPPVTTAPYDILNPVGALLSHQLKGLGDAEKFHNDISFLLVSAEEEVTGDRMYGLSTVWVNPYQARAPTAEEAVRELTTLASSGPDWPYALVWLNKDTYHVPLPREEHLGILPEGGTDNAACGRISQLEIHQLLIIGLQVIYPIGLNGCEALEANPLCRSQTRKHCPLADTPPS